VRALRACAKKEKREKKERREREKGEERKKERGNKLILHKNSRIK
jgi:hypothetical protein